MAIYMADGVTVAYQNFITTIIGEPTIDRFCTVWVVSLGQYESVVSRKCAAFDND